MALASPPLTPHGTDDEALLRDAIAGHRHAREDLARRIRRPAYLLALQLVGNRDDALDITHDAVLAFFESLDRFHPSQPIRPWLFTIVRNKVRDLWRRRSRRPTDSLDGNSTLTDHLAAPGPDPEQSAASQELRRQLWQAIRALTPPHREIVLLRDFHDLPYGDIAEVLQIPAGTVMSRLHAARKALRRLVYEGREDST